MHSLSHLLQLGLLPPGCCFLLLLLGVLVSYRYRVLGKLFIYTGIVTLWGFSTPVVSQFLIDGLQNQYAPYQFETYTKSMKLPVMVVLGAGVEIAPEYLSQHTVSLQTLARLHYAAYTAKRLGLDIIVSGGNRDQKAATEAEVMAEVLQQHFQLPVFAKEAISRNTYEESQFLLPILLQYHISQIYLVTHAWHMPRSMQCFKKVFQDQKISVIPAPMGYLRLKTERGIVNYLPSQHALQVSYYALHEYIGMLYYTLREHWLSFGQG